MADTTQSAGLRRRHGRALRAAGLDMGQGPVGRRGTSGALDVVSRASPSATVNAKSGRISMQPQAGQGSSGGTPVSVKTPAEAAALPAGTQYTTPDGKAFVR